MSKVMGEILKVVGVGLLCVMGMSVASNLQSVHGGQSIESTNQKQYVLLAANDLGMHCIQEDYSAFLLLPPANNVKVQVFEKGPRGNRLVNSGIKVLYEMIDNTTSADKVNFWEYAKDYGYDVAPNQGITGNGLKGEMVLSTDGKFYEATAIPVTPYNDSSKTPNPYQLMKVTIVDAKTGKELAMEDTIVVPVSDEMKCGVCHGETNTDLNILKAHDEETGTQLVQDLANNKRYKCADCHQDNALGEKGKEGIPPLSQAMHEEHADKMSLSPIQDPTCYSCHPGPETQCYRGIMKAEGISCGGSECHGDMEKIAKSQEEGRQAWLQEPSCQQCHDEKYSTNEGQLYRNSYLKNGPDEEMNDKIQCESCHNSPHAEWKSTLELDNKLPDAVQGKKSFIQKCSVCHTNQSQGEVHQ